MKRYNENFIDIKLTLNTVFVYSVRKSLQKSLDKCLNLFGGVLLDLGCGEMPYRQYLFDKNNKITKYIGVDIVSSEYHGFVKPDLIWDGKKIPVNDSMINTVIATELFEHIPNINNVLLEINRVLAKDGLLFFTIPFVWPLHEVPHDEYRYTPYSIEKKLRDASFREIVIKPLGDYNASLAQMMCIWVNNYRSSRNSSYMRNLFFKIILKMLVFPIIRILLKKDEKLNNQEYGENTMPTGFYGYAKK